jgi:non-heme chloroperoxidase
MRQRSSPPPAAWHDPSPHTIQFVPVDHDVRLEVLDWGGSGRPVVLLAGGGNTAHVFDAFAPKLTATAQVYGLTRRGFGASSASAATQGSERLAADVLAVLDALHLSRPVVVGHSIAGAELTALASARPDRVAGLLYLEAGYPYAFDTGTGPTMQAFQALSGLQPPVPGAAALASFSALQRWEAHVYGFVMPEAEFRQTWAWTSDGRPTKPRDVPGAAALMTLMTGPQRSTDLAVPALVIFALPHVPEPWMTTSADPTVRQAADDYFTALDALTEQQAQAVAAGVPLARVIRLGGMHYIFLSHEADVLREMRAFLADLQ